MKAPTIERFALNGAALVPTTANADARTVEVVFLSGAPIQRVDWTGEPFELVFDPAGADLSRLNSGAAPVLNSHEDRPLSAQLGIVERAWRDGGTFKAKIKLSARAEVEPIWQDLLAGVCRGVSGGFQILELVDETAKNGRLMRRTATRWGVVELSLVTIPADAGAVTLGLVGKHDTGDFSMTIQTETGAAQAEEQLRISDIQRIGTLARLTPEQIAAGVNSGVNVEAFRVQAFEAMFAAQSQHDTRVGSTAATVVRDQCDTEREAMLAALAARASGKPPTEIGRRWHGRRISDMAREILGLRGVRTFGGDGQIISTALMHSTSDFPNLLSGLANKMLLEAYTVAESALKQVARRSTASDFKQKHVIRRGEFPAILEVPEGGEFKNGTIGESKESYALGTFGRIFSITRQALVNDDLGAFGDWAFAIGQACADFEAGYLVSLITANSGAGPVMSDGYNLFDNANHGNSGTGVISVTSLDAGRLAMRTQRGLDNLTVIDARPKFLVVPAARQTVAEQYLSQITPSQSSGVNPFAGQLLPIVEPRLDVKSVSRWYLFGDPAFVPALEYAYLNGVEGPQIEQQVGFEVDGLQIKARLDFGAAAIDWRGCYISTGA